MKNDPGGCLEGYERFILSKPAVGQNAGNILFRDIADFREKHNLTKTKKQKLTTQKKKKIRGGFFVPENSKFDF